MIPDNERSPLLNEVTFKKNPFTNNGHCNIFLPKFRTGYYYLSNFTQKIRIQFRRN